MKAFSLNILQMIFFCVKQKKELQSGLEQKEDEMTEFSILGELSL